jgi:hypothetical protein
MIRILLVVTMAFTGLAATAAGNQKLENGTVIIGKSLKFQDLGYEMFLAKIKDPEGNTCYFWVQKKGEDYMGRLDVSQLSCVK